MSFPLMEIEGRLIINKHFTKEPIVAFLNEVKAGATEGEVCWRSGISVTMLYPWTAKFGGTPVSDVGRLKELEQQNERLKRLLAEAHLDNAALEDLVSRNFDARGQTAGGRTLGDEPGPERTSCLRAGCPYGVEICSDQCGEYYFDVDTAYLTGFSTTLTWRNSPPNGDYLREQG